MQQQINISDVPSATAPTVTTTTNVPYFYPPKYTHHQQPFLYHSNQFQPQSQTATPYFQSTSAFEPVHVWPHQQQQYAVPQQYTTSFDHQHQLNSELISHTKPLSNATENGYFHNEFDRNGIYYASQMSTAGSSTAVPASSSSSGECSEQNWPIMYGQNGSNGSFDTNYTTNSLNVNGTMPSFDVSMQNDREIPLDVKSRTPYEIDERKKKIPRPMNSFMLFAKRHRAQCHELYPLCDNRTVSKILSDTWYTMDAEKKREYHELASEMRQEHFRLYPDFKWKTTSNQTIEPLRKTFPDTEIVESNAESMLLSEQHRNVGNDDSNEPFSGFHNDEYGDLVNAYTPITPSSEKSLSPIGCVGKLDESKMSQSIRLGPTPAQLGLCRNKKRSTAAGNGGNGNNNDGPKSSSDDLAMVSNNPQFKQRFLNLPKFDFSNYRQSSGWDSSPTPPAITYNTSMRKRKSTNLSVGDQQQQYHHQPAKRLIGNHFFGPDFNINHFKGLNFDQFNKMFLANLYYIPVLTYLKVIIFYFFVTLDIDTSPQSSTTATPNSSVTSTPNTPNSADNVKYAKRKVQDSKKRHLLNQRQSLIMGLFQKCGFFPSAQDTDDFLVRINKSFSYIELLTVIFTLFFSTEIHRRNTSSYSVQSLFSI